MFTKIFNENQTNIEEVIQQLYESYKPNDIEEEHLTKTVVQPTNRTEVKIKNIRQTVVQPYIQRVEKHTIQRIEDQKSEKKYKILNKLYLFHIYKKKMEK